MDEWVRFLNGFLMVALPLGLGVLLAKRLQVPWKLFLIGGTTFLASQLLHIPFNQWVLRPLILWLGWEEAGVGLARYGVAVLLGLSAGIFEESARYIIYRTWLRSVRDWKQSLMFGAGHGGVEAIILGLIALANFFVLLAYRGGDLGALVAPEQLALAQSQIAAYWAAPWYMAILGAVERAFALCFHLSAAILVLQVFRKGSHAWLLLAVGWHTALNAIGLIVLQLWGAYAAEGALGILALISLYLVGRLREGEADEELPAKVVHPPLNVDLGPVERTPDRLQDSRYTE